MKIQFRYYCLHQMTLDCKASVKVLFLLKIVFKCNPFPIETTYTGSSHSAIFGTVKKVALSPPPVPLALFGIWEFSMRNQ